MNVDRHAWERFIGLYAQGRILTHTWEETMTGWPTGPDSEAAVYCYCPMTALGLTNADSWTERPPEVRTYATWVDREAEQTAFELFGSDPSWLWVQLKPREKLGIMSTLAASMLLSLQQHGFVPPDYTDEERDRDVDRIQAGISALL